MEIVNTKITDRIARVTLRREDGLNALNIQALEELRDTARRLSDKSDLAAVILTGDPVFSSGADLNEALNGHAATLSKIELRHMMKLGPDMCRTWLELEAYTIGAIEGHCVGGAAALAAVLDYRILGKSAFFRLPEVPLGMNMSWQTIPRLVAQIGPARTKEYVIFGRRVAAETALVWGLCERIVADGQTFASAEELAAEVRALPPLPVHMTKKAVNASAYALVDATSFMDRDQCMTAMETEDFRDAMASFSSRNKSQNKGNGNRKHL